MIRLPFSTSLCNAAREATQRLTAIVRRFNGTDRTTSSLPESRPTASVPIEWGVNMDTITLSFQDEETEVKLKGRCKRCWGDLKARQEKIGESTVITGIMCRICGAKLEGEEAQSQFNIMLDQAASNLQNLQCGRFPKYDDKRFVHKIFPTIEPLPQQEFDARVQRKLTERRSRNKLTRHDFPPGSPGFLFIQAHILIAGVAEVSYPDEMSVADAPDVQVNDDGSLTACLSLEGFKGDLDYSNNRLKNRMGTTMIEAMTAAFACELAMKAICLTCADEAPKTHDLIELHDRLPSSSRERILADCPEIVETLQAARHTFGQWRYFEVNVGEAGMRTMIDVLHAHALGKAARIILDEAVMVGLGASVNMETKDNVSFVGDTENHRFDFRLRVRARETPPRGS